MKLDAPTQVVRLINHFNKADNPLVRYALASALRDELTKIVDTLDVAALPMCKKAMIEIVSVDG